MFVEGRALLQTETSFEHFVTSVKSKGDIDVAHTCIMLETRAKIFTLSQVGCLDPQYVAALSLVLRGLNTVIV